ncbi:MAG TPA: glycosyltransferase [Anaeromyxobacteraceae bacterium]|nr:glycosyltransferase [Anaeromyxobacteraceae bacterium]
MGAWFSLLLLCAAALGLGLLLAQCFALRKHTRAPAVAPGRTPAISILKPLCGLDEDLEANLASFADLDYERYEVVLSVKSECDPAWEVAGAAARRWPARFRVVTQCGEPGLNPKVNQLVTLVRAARHEVLVVSDSNVRVDRGYLTEIAALLEDDRVGLVTHPIVGVGERGLGSLMDHLHLACSVGPGMVAAHRLAGRDIVVGKSMAIRRSDLAALGGFESVKDVLAEDYFMGLMITRVLGKRVAVARIPVQNVSARRTVGEFTARYCRWAVIQRQAVGPLAYAAQGLLNPVLLALVAVGFGRSLPSAAMAGGVCAVKIAIDRASARALRAGGFRPAHLAFVPAKDLLFGFAWAYGFLRREVDWRGTRLRVLRGTQIDASRFDHGAARGMQAVYTAEHN